MTLEPEVFTSSTAYDALNRPVTATSPDGSVTRPAFNEANLLERIDVNLRGETSNRDPIWTPFVTDIDYNAKGQRESIDYGNGVSTEYSYDPLTFRLLRLLTRRDATAYPDDCPPNPPAGWPGCAVQNLRYTYDPAGNITHIQDDAQQTIYFRNKRVDPSNDYTYDAIYQLIEATGREHLGQVGGIPNTPTAPDAFNGFHTGLLQPGDGNAMGLYRESYFYDVVGNFLAMQHRGTDPSNPGWTRNYTYQERSLTDLNQVSNRLSTTQVGTELLERYTYDAHGSMTSMPNLPVMRWTFLDQLQASSKQVFNGGAPETTYYVYDAAGQRVRKVTERMAAVGETPTRMKERIYLGGFELYREYSADGATATLERETLHVMDDQQRIAMVETRSLGDDGTADRLTRYQFSNHLGSASLELNEAGQLISYEEYFPYGSTSYQPVDSGIRAAAKRYRYTGMERDEETGLAYHSARYYLGWLGRWVMSDPIALKGGINSYSYVRNRPTSLSDPSGKVDPEQEQTWGQWALSWIVPQGDPLTGAMEVLNLAYTGRASEVSPNAGQEAIAGTPNFILGMFLSTVDLPIPSVPGRSRVATESAEALQRGTLRLVTEVVEHPGAGVRIAEGTSAQDVMAARYMENLARVAAHNEPITTRVIEGIGNVPTILGEGPSQEAADQLRHFVPGQGFSLTVDPQTRRWVAIATHNPEEPAAAVLRSGETFPAAPRAGTHPEGARVLSGLDDPQTALQQGFVGGSITMRENNTITLGLTSGALNRRLAGARGSEGRVATIEAQNMIVDLFQEMGFTVEGR